MMNTRNNAKMVDGTAGYARHSADPNSDFEYIDQNYKKTTIENDTAVEKTVDYARHSAKTVDEAGYANSAAICAIQKDGLRYIDEWVVYNLAVGFDTLYIYDNSESYELEPWHKTLAKPIQERVVIKHFPRIRAQRPAYTDCWEEIRSHKSHSWIAFFDLDEFLVIRNRTKYPQIMDLLDHLPADYGGLAVNWVMVGFNDQRWYEPKPVTLRFQKRDPNSTKELVKTIVKTEVEPNVRSAHFVEYNRSQTELRTKDTRGNVIRGAQNAHLVDETVALYHYHTYSFDEFKERCARGDVAKKRKHWTAVLACQDNKTILETIKYDETLKDDAAWELLKERAPDFVAPFL